METISIESDILILALNTGPFWATIYLLKATARNIQTRFEVLNVDCVNFIDI